MHWLNHQNRTHYHTDSGIVQSNRATGEPEPEVVVLIIFVDFVTISVRRRGHGAVRLHEHLTSGPSSPDIAREVQKREIETIRFFFLLIHRLGCLTTANNEGRTQEHENESN